MRFLPLLAIVASLVGCANYEAMTTDEFAARQAVERSDFERHIKLDGGQIIADLPGGILDTGDVYLRIRGWIDKRDSSIQSHQLYLHISYSTPGSWRFYERATFRGGDVASVTKISRDVNYCMSTRCGYTEVIGVDLPIDSLLIGERIEIQITSKSGHKAIVAVPENYVVAYFDLIQRNT